MWKRSQRSGRCFPKPRKSKGWSNPPEASRGEGTDFPSQPSVETDLAAPQFWTSILQNWGSKNLLCKPLHLWSCDTAGLAKEHTPTVRFPQVIVHGQAHQHAPQHCGHFVWEPVLKRKVAMWKFLREKTQWTSLFTIKGNMAPVRLVQECERLSEESKCRTVIRQPEMAVPAFLCRCLPVP
jgi:hypothetical protein